MGPMNRRQMLQASTAAALTGASLVTGTQAQASDDMQQADGLAVVAETRRMIWNAVAVDGNRIFVAGPRWAGANGPAVALIDGKDALIPYPDASWNAWQPGADVTNAFVNVNAIRRDDRGGLWIIDTGSPSFGGDPLPGAAKAVRIDLASSRVERIYPFGPQAALPGSYIDDIRFHGDYAYLTDAGRAGLIVLNLRGGETRRVLDGAPSVTAPTNRPIVVDGKIVRAPDGSPLRVNSDPLEVSPDGRYLYFGSLHGPWSRIETRLLDDPAIPGSELAGKVEAWADIPPVGGTAMASDGTLYFTDLASDALQKRSPEGTITTLIRDSRLHWGDAPALADGFIWLPVPQIDRVSLFNNGTSRIEWPIRLYRYRLDVQAK